MTIFTSNVSLQIVPGDLPAWHPLYALPRLQQAIQRSWHWSATPAATAAAAAEEAGSHGFLLRLQRRHLLARSQAAVGSPADTTTAGTATGLPQGAAHAAKADPDHPADADAAIADTSTATATDTATVSTPAELRLTNGEQQVPQSKPMKLIHQLIRTSPFNAMLTTPITNTTGTWASRGGLLYDDTLDTSDLDSLRSDLETLDTANLESLRLESITLDASDLLRAYEQMGLLQHQISSSATNATAATAENPTDADVGMASKPRKPKYPITDWPAVLPGWVNPGPPCMDGMVQQGMTCVCPPGQSCI